MTEWKLCQPKTRGARPIVQIHFLGCLLLGGHRDLHPTAGTTGTGLSTHERGSTQRCKFGVLASWLVGRWGGGVDCACSRFSSLQGVWSTYSTKRRRVGQAED